jgi:hypothetical protein
MVGFDPGHAIHESFCFCLLSTLGILSRHFIGRSEVQGLSSLHSKHLQRGAIVVLIAVVSQKIGPHTDALNGPTGLVSVSSTYEYDQTRRSPLK